MHILQTARLRLEQLSVEHAPLALRLYGDPRVNKYLGGPTHGSLEEERAALMRHTERMWNVHDHGLMAGFLQCDRTFVGICGLLHWEIEDAQETEVAYAVLPEHWGRGYATEAAKTLAEDAFGRLGRKRLISLIVPENVSSIRVALKNGMTLERQTTLFNKVVNVYAREASTSASRS